MCFHDKPTRNDRDSYGVEWRAPDTQPGDVLLFDECGRCAPSPQEKGKTSIDYHAYHFRLVQRGGWYVLLVRHGRGDESIQLGTTSLCLAELLGKHDTDGRYLLLHALYDAHEVGERRTREETTRRYEVAFLEGRLKKRKRNHRLYVEIKPREVKTVEAATI